MVMAGKKQYEITKEFLILEYVKNKKSSTKIASEFGCSINTINNRLKEFKIEVRNRGYHNIKNIDGMKFGFWTVIRKVGSRRKCMYWLCQCDCGEFKEIHCGGLTSGQRIRCKRCAGIALRSKDELNKTIWCGIKSCAKNRGITFSIKRKDAFDLFVIQNRKCALTGLEISFAETTRDHNRGKTTASLDRINSTLGYEHGNIQWTHKDINLMKGSLCESRFYNLCELVVLQNLCGDGETI